MNKRYPEHPRGILYVGMMWGLQQSLSSDHLGIISQKPHLRGILNVGMMKGL